MYLKCHQCGNKYHISEWARVGKYEFQCPTVTCKKNVILTL